MKQLIENQMKEFRENFLSENNAGQICWSILGRRTELIIDWHKQSFKQFIDGLIAREEGEFQDEHPVDCIDGVTPVETYGYEATYNQAKKETISHLKKLKEELN